MRNMDNNDKDFPKYVRENASKYTVPAGKNFVTMRLQCYANSRDERAYATQLIIQDASSCARR